MIEALGRRSFGRVAVPLGAVLLAVSGCGADGRQIAEVNSGESELRTAMRDGRVVYAPINMLECPDIEGSRPASGVVTAESEYGGVTIDAQRQYAESGSAKPEVVCGARRPDPSDVNVGDMYVFVPVGEEKAAVTTS